MPISWYFEDFMTQIEFLNFSSVDCLFIGLIISYNLSLYLVICLQNMYLSSSPQLFKDLENFLSNHFIEVCRKQGHKFKSSGIPSTESSINWLRKWSHYNLSCKINIFNKIFIFIFLLKIRFLCQYFLTTNFWILCKNLLESNDVENYPRAQLHFYL